MRRPGGLRAFPFGCPLPPLANPFTPLTPCTASDGREDGMIASPLGRIGGERERERELRRRRICGGSSLRGERELRRGPPGDLDMRRGPPGDLDER